MDETIALTKEYGNYASYCMLLRQRTFGPLGSLGQQIR